MELTFNELVQATIIVFGLIAVVLVFSEQVARLIYVWLWRIRRE